MATFGRRIGKKAAKATVRHSARGVAAKAHRRPVRSVTLVGVGGMLGATAGFFAGRRGASQHAAPAK